MKVDSFIQELIVGADGNVSKDERNARITSMDWALNCEELAGMERIMAGIMIANELDRSLLNTFLSNFIFKSIKMECRSNSQLMFDRDCFSKRMMSNWHSRHSWTMGVGLWESRVRLGYISALGYGYNYRQFLYEPRIIEEVLGYRERDVRHEVYKLWGLVDE